MCVLSLKKMRVLKNCVLCLKQWGSTKGTMLYQKGVVPKWHIGTYYNEHFRVRYMFLLTL